VTGHEVTQAYAVGANRGEEFFRAAGDVDTACAVLTLDDGTLATVNCGRYNAGGYDVRLEVLGSVGGVGVGLDDRMPLRSAEPGVSFPAGSPHRQFMERFGAAYAAELAAFTEVVAGRMPSPCTLEDALEGFYVAEACEQSRQRNQPVLVAEVRR
jgi:myo-inositol 2-dehydrogenase/D-chiro-inositol 1-dehydrogenase